MTAARRYRVVFDQDAIDEDLKHATQAARQVGEQAVARLTRDGITKQQLFPCRAEERDGTRLPGCLKTYLPWPDGRWGMVFEFRFDSDGPWLFCRAFGVRHPARDSRRPSVYQVADRRLNPPNA